MEIIFGDEELKELYTKGKSKIYNKDIINGFFRKMAIFRQIKDEKELYAMNSLHFEKLNNYPKWEYSIRINQKRRIVFNIHLNWEQKIISIEELSNHYS